MVMQTKAKMTEPGRFVLRRYFCLACFLLCAGFFSAGCGGPSPRPATPAAVPTVTPRILRQLPHDTLAFTQGLLVHDGYLYESTGSPPNRESSLRRIDPQTGTLQKLIPVEKGFAEGIAVLDDHLLQLTWQSEYALVYAMPQMIPEGKVLYRGEGWGLTTAGRKFLMSDGSDSLILRDSGFNSVQRLGVTYRGTPLTNINELEYARKHVYANVWYSTSIFVISVQTGAVVQVIDCKPLIDIEQPPSPNNVLNGIAWNRETDTFYLTGKNWRTLFEVALPPVTR